MGRKMKKNNRLKILLIILGALIASGLYYKFVFSKQIDTLKDLKAKKSDYEGKLINSKNQEANIKNLENNLNRLEEKIKNKNYKLLPFLEQEKIIVIINDIFEDSGINGPALGLSEVSVEGLTESDEEEIEQKPILENIINDYLSVVSGKGLSNREDSQKEENSKEKEQEEETIPMDTEKVTVTISYSGTYEQLRAFIDRVEAFPKKIIISNLNMTVLDEKNLTGNIVLDFYFAPNIFEDDESFMKWRYTGDYGKDNPFEGSFKNKTGERVYSGSVKKIRKYDFIMTVSPTSSDIQSVILGKSEDRKRSTYISTDSEGVVPVEIYFSEHGGKYYYKYRMDGHSYPSSFEGYGIEFIPNGETINLKINSAIRNSEKDLSGANIKVFNSTYKKVLVKIQNDDIKRPRVNVLRASGELIVEK
jgi:type IV pilus assembly protein PilO